jgi:hypothetical protein
LRARGLRRTIGEQVVNRRSDASEEGDFAADRALWLIRLRQLVCR